MQPSVSTTGGRDPASLRRLVGLLWRRTDTGRPGPKPALTLDQIVDVAIDLADRRDLAAVTMRAVADELGCSTMSLYTYVGNKDDLLDLMYDQALGELPRRSPGSQGWRAAVEAHLADRWDLFQRHPWMLRLAQARPSLGPHTFAAMEILAGILRETGMSAADVDRAARAIGDVVRGAALAVADVRSAARASELSDDEWWTVAGPALEEASSRVDWAARFPNVTWLAEAGVFGQPDRDPEDTSSYLEHDAVATYTFGITRLLDGIEADLARTTPPNG